MCSILFLQEALRHHKVKVSKYEAKVRSFYQELEEVLGEDQDLYMMHLTRMQQNKEVDPEAGHDEVCKHTDIKPPYYVQVRHA